MRKVLLSLAIACLAAMTSQAQWNSGYGIYNTADGKVGIGTPSPVSGLDLNMQVTSTLQQGLFVHTGSFLNQPNAVASYFIKAMDDGYPVPQFIVKGDGATGIGTGSPVSRLDVYMPAVPTLQQGLFLHSGSFGNAPNAQASYFIKAQDDGNGAAQFIVHGDGATGIATDAVPGYKLAVNGSVICLKVVVKPMPWPDYVFKPTYKLQPLKKVEQYIKTNHHLPDMPSADSVSAAGIDVGANQAALLKKIEELTLYVIEQNKKIDALTEQNKKLDTLAERIKQLEKHK